MAFFSFLVVCSEYNDAASTRDCSSGLPIPLNYYEERCKDTESIV